MASRGGLPPRWKNCPRNGDLFFDLFVPFKVPLADSFNSQLPIHSYFTPKMFLGLMKSQKIDIGLWVDLTNTSRFYDKETVEAEGVGYIKLKCRGFQETPSEEQVDTFSAVVSRFLDKSPNKKIAVHCTHGFNRTGFLICAYLVNEIGWELSAAIGEFAKCRPPGIYKQDYIDELFRRYDSIDNKLSAPQKPDWCFEDSQYEDDEAEVNGGGSGNSNTLPGSSNADNPLEGIDGIFLLHDQEKIKPAQKMCTSMCKFRKNGFPGSQPVSMNHENISLIQKEEYMVSWKADGTRYMLLIMGPDEMYFFDRDFKVFQLFNVKFPGKHPNGPLTNTLMDGELVVDVVDGKRYPRYLIYDIIYVDGQDVSQNNFRQRLNIIFKQVVCPRDNAKRSGLIDREREPIGIRIKDFCNIKDTYKYFSSKFQKVLSHEIDGLIFQPVNMGYEAGRCDKALKWKPPSHNSVDFRLCVVKETRAGMVEDYIGQLFVGGQENPFSYIKVTKALKNYNNKIIECRFNAAKNGWEFMRERTDKSYPNAYTTAVSVCNSIRYPITRDYLLEYINKYRFRS